MTSLGLLIRGAGRVVVLLLLATVFTTSATAGAGAATSPGMARLSETLAIRARLTNTPGTTVAAPSPAPIAAPSIKNGATLAGVLLGVQARSRPDGGRPVWHVNPQTSWSKEPMVLLILGSAARHGRQWVRVLLPIRPDGASGWIPRNDVVLLHTRYWVHVNTTARRVTVYDAGRAIRRFRAVVGKPSTPTPTGLAAIYEKDRQADPTAFLGTWAMPLTILSDALRRFEGGPGRIAIHGRDGLSLLNPLGTAASHGCIRIDNGPVTWLAGHLSQGTPVQITR